MENISIITATPEANGFFTAKDLSKNIPRMYSVLEKEFFDKISNNIKINEYNKESWTFHAKGLWMNKEKVMISLIGRYFFIFQTLSPNFGNRSKNLDVESQVMILTENEFLKKRLNEEKEKIFSHSTLVSQGTFDSNYRKPGFFFKRISKIFTKFL
jgi:CDP-diacylglycerol---glycerol-3-phosphate 3-phosphatidyltransferase